jgi:hypothetical protein
MVNEDKPSIDPETIAQLINQGREENDNKFTIKPIDEVDLDSLIDDNMNETFISSVDGSEISFQELIAIMRDRKSNEH